MRHDIPAALPLIAFVAGLAIGPVLVNPGAFVVGLLATAAFCRPLTRSLASVTTCPLPAGAGGISTTPLAPGEDGAQRRVTGLSIAPLFLALGILVALRVERQRANELRAFASFDEERFVRVVAPMERDWAAGGSSFVLRAETFTANGSPFRERLAIYARFEPQAMQLQSEIACEGLLRRSERGYYTLTLRSPRLMEYAGELHGPARWNRTIANRLRPHAQLHPIEVALVEALVLGRGERLTDEVRDSFKRGGTYHLLVFSGLQIAFAAGCIAALLRWAHAPRASDWLLLAFALVAPLFIGFTASVSRASIGIGLYALARILKRPTSIENLWCVAALLRLALEPRDLTDPSFHLTYAGAGALLFIARNRHWLLHAFAAELAITPLTLFHFHQFAIGGSLLTLAMSPLVFAMLIVSMGACVLPCETLFKTIALLHRVCATMNVGAYSGFFTAPHVAAMIAGFGLALAALLLRAGRGVAIGAALTIPLIASLAQFRSARVVEHPRVTFLDVGQGDAAVVRTGPHVMLVDGGGRIEDGRAGDTRLLPLLLDRGIGRIDAVVLTHAHPDHCGGLPAVVEHLDVGEVWISPRRFRGDCAQRLLDACRTTATPIRLVRAPFTMALADARITALVADRTFRRAPENNASIVLEIVLAGRMILLTGDVEREAEVYFLDRLHRADILKVAHHGSRSSTTRWFLDEVGPRLAVISCGRRNLFGHPHPSVLDALTARRARVWRTDRDGTIDIELASGVVAARGEIDTPR